METAVEAARGTTTQVGWLHKNKTTAILLAVFCGPATWAYTWEKDSAMFLVNVLLMLVTLGLWGIVAWIVAIVQSASRTDYWYWAYPHGDMAPAHDASKSK